MFQFIILGLLFLFIVLHFYTDIKNYINTGNIIEGNDEDATVPNAGAGADSSAEPLQPVLMPVLMLLLLLLPLLHQNQLTVI